MRKLNNKTFDSFAPIFLVFADCHKTAADHETAVPGIVRAGSEITFFFYQVTKICEKRIILHSDKL